MTIAAWFIFIVVASFALGTVVLEADKRRMSDKSVTRFDLFMRKVKMFIRRILW